MEVIKTTTDTIHQSMASTTRNILSYNLHSAGPPETARDRAELGVTEVTTRTARPMDAIQSQALPAGV